jgi:hypothetical protein
MWEISIYNLLFFGSIYKNYMLLPLNISAKWMLNLANLFLCNLLGPVTQLLSTSFN